MSSPDFSLETNAFYPPVVGTPVFDIHTGLQIPEVESLPIMPTVALGSKTWATALEWSTELKQVHASAVTSSMTNGWHHQDPRTFVNDVVSAAPDNPRQYSAQQRLGMPIGKTPALLEQFLLSSVPSLKLPEIDMAPAGSLAVLESIKCLRDEVRTKRFLQALDDSLTMLESTTGGAIEVLDAGSGATPILAIYAALHSPRTRVTALELNPYSAAISRQIVDSLGLGSRVTVVDADATTYIPERPIDLLVSETMHTGLSSEPLVQVLNHLQPYVSPDGVTLPSSVDVKTAVVARSALNKPQGYVQISGKRHPFVDADWTNVASYVPGQPLERIQFTVPETDFDAEGSMIMMSSEVKLGRYTLNVYDSLITLPQSFHDPYDASIIFPGGATARDVEISYRPGERLRMLPEAWHM